MATWEETIQQWGTVLVQGAADKEFNQQYELEKLRLMALGPGGYYDEGQAGVYNQSQGTLFGMSSGSLLLIGGALVVMLLVTSD